MSADVHGLSGAYAVDALDEAERRAFEAHLAQCDECRAEVAGLRAAAVELGSLTETAPPPSLRDAVLSQITSIRPLPPVTGHGSEPSPLAGAAPVLPLRRRAPGIAWLGVAAAAVLVLVVGLAWHPWTGPAAPRLSAAEQVLQAPDAQRFTQEVGDAEATIVRSVSVGRAVLIAQHMAPAPAGKDLQLWLDEPGAGMVSAGLMPHSGAASVTVVLQGDAATATAAGITLEPAGGSTQPTTTPLALFSFT